MNLSYGSQGEDVKKLQKALNENGYSLDVDGIFGQNTQSAVEDYQRKNGLDVDGIAGEMTQGKLYAVKPPEQAVTETQAQTQQTVQQDTGTGGTQEAPKRDYTNAIFQPSESVMKLAEQAAGLTAPAEWSGGQFGQAMQDAMDKILNREPFRYDMNSDALYQQYKDQYVQGGKMAMMDTMGQAAALTGGYGNSYASSAGNQAYQRYLTGLNDKATDLYSLAMQKYNLEGDQLAQGYQMAADQYAREYGEWQDQQNRYLTERNYLNDQYNDAYAREYQQWAADREYDWQREQEATDNAQWQTEFDENKRRYDQEYAQEYGTGGAVSGGSTGNGGGSTGTGGGGNNPHGFTDSEVLSWQKKLGVTQDGIWGAKTEAAYQAYLAGQGAQKTNTPNVTSYEPVQQIAPAKGYNEETHKKLFNANGGSYYNSVLSDIEGSKKTKTYAEQKSYLMSMYQNSYLNKTEYDKLLDMLNIWYNR